MGYVEMHAKALMSIWKVRFDAIDSGRLHESN
jgi:hypothetical protein